MAATGRLHRHRLSPTTRRPRKAKCNRPRTPGNRARSSRNNSTEGQARQPTSLACPARTERSRNRCVPRGSRSDDRGTTPLLAVAFCHNIGAMTTPTYGRDQVRLLVESFALEARYVLGTVDLGRADCEYMSCVVQWWLDERGYPAETLLVAGLRVPLGSEPAPFVESVLANGGELVHQVCLLGPWAIDLTGRQFGEEFAEPVVALEEFCRRWSSQCPPLRALGGRMNPSAGCPSFERLRFQLLRAS